MKIYTRTGDDGTTGLIGGSRVPKSDARIECYGTVDELNATIGLAAVAASGILPDQLRAVQAELFVIGSRLAAPADSRQRTQLPSIDSSTITRLENQMDSAETTLAPLRNFILPGGTELAARLHLARTVCRRAERLIVGLGADEPDSATLVMYLNRLSDWLFVQARAANLAGGVADIPWVGRQ